MRCLTCLSPLLISLPVDLPASPCLRSISFPAFCYKLGPSSDSSRRASCCTCPSLRCVVPWTYLFLCMRFGVLAGQLGFKHGFTHLQGEQPCCLRFPMHFENAILPPFTEAAVSGGGPRKRKCPISQVSWALPCHLCQMC